MLERTASDPQEDFTRFVRGWYKLVAAGKWDEAFATIDLPPNYGDPYSAERFRREVELDHFAPGTRFAKAHPEGIIYFDPDSLSGDGRPSLYQRKGGATFQFELDVPLNGEWSDLTSGWEFIVDPRGYLVRLDWLHVL